MPAHFKWYLDPLSPKKKVVRVAELDPLTKLSGSVHVLFTKGLKVDDNEGSDHKQWLRWTHVIVAHARLKNMCKYHMV